MSTPLFSRFHFTHLLLLAASCAGATACLSAGDGDAVSIGDAPASDLQGITIVPTNPTSPPPPPPPPPPPCVANVNSNPAFGCLTAAWIYGPGVGLESMLSSAVGCGCEAEIVTTGVVPAACNVQRVAVSCSSGTPPFNAVSPIPPGEYPCEGLTNDDGTPQVVEVNTNEIPFMGIHIDPDNNGQLCDVTLDPFVGPIDREIREKCSSCHTDNEPNWWPEETDPGEESCPYCHANDEPQGWPEVAARAYVASLEGGPRPASARFRHANLVRFRDTAKPAPLNPHLELLRRR
ncbi:hypothetical protein [Polyangium sorediatum]|uniref:Uncharacterized protein n=1 Tax=Polyangium sorediatum TaxID=889274 RepID=A0ABT6P1S7_9BACT|nr:hypothetical protein [Polyangium sorediatum]MDI1434533.1 hypothetical protein [Polyangium sorediatum]